VGNNRPGVTATGTVGVMATGQSVGVQASGSLYGINVISGGINVDPGGINVLGDSVFSGRLTINNQPNGGIPLCYAYIANFLTQCASSRSFKKNIDDFGGGLDLVRVLRPVTFDWKSEDRHDMGLIAEEVESVEPLLTTHQEDGRIQGVRYDLIGVVLINAVKEQQALIEAQQKQSDELKKQVDQLMAVVCSLKSDADICAKGK
jgi:hypothetical protein